ncbi:sensor histidine kinase [Streptomyces stelliscabiei]|uniref:sensor histidine kinase n=1 Tax=Streptomyces stelliscabiei TaxID=146820 RepID=UPI0029A20B89|nr:ATP-binding protein [Streptomyces stelliscabiei]MDX2555370.1 ATP-binding protein [Streptomyces stelliscabiei]MDX2637534.1 ATP-binding protein [Streptomyces stelliscabiei]MDX2789621.1 ATP-binding protein [Streptomyces stelliscabiei]MDX3437216.1 ATP-binding protein [Streptomyces stelliscabiei]MDX3624167.1 ATP-binding protein [Streptomyces stelliscabiei]
MSHLRAPAARADRREGGRHGRSATRAVPSLPEIHIRPQLMRLAVLPPTAVALSACAAVLFTFRAGGARPSLTLWAVLAGTAAVALAGIAIGAVAAGRTAGSVRERLGALRQVSSRSEDDLRALVDALRRGDQPPARGPHAKPAADADDFELLTADLARAHDSAVTAVVQASQLSSHAGNEQKLEVFVNLARRLQSLVQREISILDDLENEIEDPDLLKGLFHVDHLATRIRRHAENLAVLGGAVSRRQWSNPVSMTEVLRSAIAEVEQYSRVKLVPPVDGTLRGHAVADVIHLLAELVENATVFSAPHTQVLLRANLVTSGLAVEVEDRGLGMPVTEQNKMNALLADPDQVNVASLLQDGRIGLFVVSQLARRHGIQVRLQSNIYGGVQAAFIVPQGLLGSEPGDLPLTQPRTGAQTGIQTQPHAGQSTGVRHPDKPRHAQAAPPQRSSGSGPADRLAADRSGRPATDRPAPAQPGRPAPARPEPGHRSAPSPARASVPRQQGPGRAGDQQGPGRGSGGPVPLPMRRGARDERPNPAEAVPGVRPDDRRTVTENAGTPPTPRVGGAVRGTMGKPQLPRRRAQEHIVPQLRGGPAPTPSRDPDHYIGHDPGLMAAFQRGIGLAEARQSESSDWDTSTLDTSTLDTSTPAPTAADLTPPAPDAASRIDTGQLGSGHLNTGHPHSPHLNIDLPTGRPAPSAHGGTRRADARPVEPGPREAPRKDAAQPLGGHPRGAAPIAVPPSALDAAHDRTSRQDGSAPAG